MDAARAKTLRWVVIALQVVLIVTGFVLKQNGVDLGTVAIVLGVALTAATWYLDAKAKAAPREPAGPHGDA